MLMAIKSYIMDEMYGLEKQKQASQISSKVNENNQQVNTGLIEELKIKTQILKVEREMMIIRSSYYYNVRS